MEGKSGRKIKISCEKLLNSLSVNAD